jgi:hypothetical protein
MKKPVSITSRIAPWYIKDSTLVGLRAEAASHEALRERLPGMVRDLIELEYPSMHGKITIEINTHETCYAKAWALPARSRTISARLAAISCATARAITILGIARSLGRHLTVDHKILSRHTANGILKDAGIGKKF